MTRAILASITTALAHLITWPGWTDKDRTYIHDIGRQIRHLERRRVQREIDLHRGGK